MTNITGNGVNAILATLGYDQEVLKLIGLEAQNGWATPEINNDTGRLVTEKGSLVNENQVIFIAKFDILDQGRETVISMTDITTSDSMQDIAAPNVAVTVNIPAPEPTPASDTPTEDEQQPAEQIEIPMEENSISIVTPDDACKIEAVETMEAENRREMLEIIE